MPDDIEALVDLCKKHGLQPAFEIQAETDRIDCSVATTAQAAAGWHYYGPPAAEIRIGNSQYVTVAATTDPKVMRKLAIDLLLIADWCESTEPAETMASPPPTSLDDPRGKGRRGKKQ